jgi:undecaprenyl phosphate-alpha-L-ara4FN deformylase
MPFLALKVDVDTLRGTREGVPRLLALLARLDIQATFLFSLGPDHTGRAIKRIFRRGFFSKVQRTSVLSHYGLKTLLYGTLLPGPDIARHCANLMRATRAEGHETGIHTWDHILWQDQVRHRDARWTQNQIRLAAQRYEEIFAAAPTTHGAAGWQINDAALLEFDHLGLRYASDGRGDRPFYPKVQGRRLRCLQLPTTLPTLDELIGLNEVTESNVAQVLLQRTAQSQTDQVFTLHAELEGGKLLPVFEQLLLGWKAQGYTLGSLERYYEQLNPDTLDSTTWHWGSVPGRSGEVMLQGAETSD